MKALGTLLLVLLVPGGLVIGFGVYLRRRWLARQDAAVDGLIVPPVQKFGVLDPAEYDAVLREATQRRLHAAAIRKDAGRVTTKDDRASKLHLAGGRG